MTQSIDQNLVTQFSSEVLVRAQQMKTRFRGNVKEVFVRGNDAAIERIDSVGSIEVTTRHADTVAQDITHDRRQIKMREFRSTILLDEFDDLQVLIDPQRQYAESVARELMRNYDRVVAEAAFASVNTGRNFGTSVTFANDEGVTIASGSTGLTYDKLLEVKENFIDNDVNTDMGERLMIGISSKGHTDLMKEVELTSGDFTRDLVVEKGQITRAAGFDLIQFSGTQSPAVISKTGSDRDNIAFSSEGIVVGINKDIGVRIDRRPDKNNAIQVQASMFFGATRADGRRVIKVQSSEA